MVAVEQGLLGGMDKPGTLRIVPTVVSAIYAATGKRLRKVRLDACALGRLACRRPR
jgi:hypothetical protein